MQCRVGCHGHRAIYCAPNRRHVGDVLDRRRATVCAHINGAGFLRAFFFYAALIEEKDPSTDRGLGNDGARGYSVGAARSEGSSLVASDDRGGGHPCLRRPPAAYRTFPSGAASPVLGRELTDRRSPSTAALDPTQTSASRYSITSSARASSEGETASEA